MPQSITKLGLLRAERDDRAGGAHRGIATWLAEATAFPPREIKLDLTGDERRTLLGAGF
jgi:hypothetical protein